MALQTGRFVQGEELIGKALRLRHDDAGAHSNLGAALRALRRHEEALASYDRAIALRPDLATAYSNRGLVLLDLQRHVEALASFDRAIALKPDHAEAYYNRGNVLAGLRRHEEALASFDRAITLKPNFAEAHADRGAALAQLQRPEAALASFDRAIALKRDYAEAYANRGVVLKDLLRYEEALASLDKAIALKPDDADAHANRGVVLGGLQRHAEALVSCDRAIALKPGFVEAIANREYVLEELQRREHRANALASFDAAIALAPDDAAAHISRGNALFELDRPAEALAAYDRAVMLDPTSAVAHLNRANVLLKLDRLDDALADYDRALALRPEFWEAWHNSSALLQRLARHAAAIAGYARARALRPDYVDTQWNESLSRLALGDYQEGWRKYEWRKRRVTPVGNREYPQPVWLGDTSIAGKTLFIHWEQGLGDTLQFCRYGTLAQARGARVIMSVQEPMRRLLETLGPDITVIGGNEVPGRIRLSLPDAEPAAGMRHNAGDDPAGVALSCGGCGRGRSWRGRLAAVAGLRVGLCWAGNPRRDTPAAHAIDRRRSIALAQFAPLAWVTGAIFVSLQKGAAAAQAAAPPGGLSMHDWTDELADFADTAALIAALDLVITVDTAVAHLAGALGKPVWILNRFDACWRWLADRDDSPWYPSARLWRQPRPGDWDSVIADVARALHDLAHDVSAGAIRGACRHPRGTPSASGVPS